MAGVSEPYKHTIRAFLVYFHTQILRHSTERFNFRNGCVGGHPACSQLCLRLQPRDPLGPGHSSTFQMACHHQGRGMLLVRDAH